MIDTHCHVDLFADPLGIARTLERDLSMCVAVTMLPSQFELARRHLIPFKRVIPGLGLHPLRVREAQREIHLFQKLAAGAKFIGEIGIDGSAEGKATLALQKELFAEAISSIQPDTFVTVHSRGAWRETLELLTTHGRGPVCFHYFTGGMDGSKTLLAAGHYLSVNYRMIASDSRHRLVVAGLPRERVLVETDAPFLSRNDPVAQLKTVYDFFAGAWQIEVTRAQEQIRQNFLRCRTIKAAPASSDLFAL
jgi:TatD DNase family protein